MLTDTSDNTRSILIVGASRELGHAMAAEFLTRGWNVVGTVKGAARTDLHDLADAHPGRLEVASLDVTEPDQITALRARLDGRRFDIRFHNAGIADAHPRQSVGQGATAAFVEVMMTNAPSPMRVIEGLPDLVPPAGLIGVMSSGQGSIGDNEHGGPNSIAAARRRLTSSGGATRRVMPPISPPLCWWLRAGSARPSADRTLHSASGRASRKP